MPNTIAPNPLARFYHWEAVKPDAVFMCQPRTVADGTRQWQQYTWRETGIQVRSMAAALLSYGLPKGTRISIMSQNCAHWVMADLAIMMAGYVCAPIFTTVDAAAINYIIDHADVQVLFVGDSANWQQVSAAIPTSVKLISFPGTELGSQSLCRQQKWDDLVANSEPLAGSVPPNENDLKTIIYTSGTTGMPKGVMLSYLSSGAAIANLTEFSKATQADRFFSYMPLAHGAERKVVEGQAIYCGGEITFNESQASFIADLVACKPTLILAVPRIWTKLQQLCVSKLNVGDLDTLTEQERVEIGHKARQLLGMDEVRFAFTGAAPTPAPLHAWYQKMDLPLCELYGQTEMLSGISSSPTVRKLGFVGKVMPNVSLRIDDNGEILLCSKAQMIGYWNDPIKTAETITDDGFLRTGDKGEAAEDGFVRIIGRLKEEFKTAKGKYVAPAPIEGAFADNLLLEQVCLMGAGYPQTMVVATLSPQGLATAIETLKENIFAFVTELNSRLQSYEQIAGVLLQATPWTMEEGFLTHTMKLKRDAIEQRYMLRLADFMGERWGKLKIIEWTELA